MHDITWTLKLQMDAQERLPKLKDSISFEDIAITIAKNLAVLCCHTNRIEGTDFQRPVYTVEIGRTLFDQFFNSATGYRAQYFRSPWAGLQANALFMKTILPPILESAPSTASVLSVDFIRESLSTLSAKAWLTEHGKEIDLECPSCKGEWSSGLSGHSQIAEIINGRWEIASGQKAEWGRKAPYLTKLRIMGAFLDSRYNEFVPFDKRFRANDIYQFGYS
ncbi:MAG: hypothetical protein AB1552_01520 [Nitrospirota bacterium]